MAADGSRFSSNGVPSADAVGARPLGYLLLAIAWTTIAVCIMAIWGFLGVWLLAPDDEAALFVSAGAYGAVWLFVVGSPSLGALTLAVPAALSQAAFGWSFFWRSLSPANRLHKLSVNVGSARFPLFAPVQPTALQRRILPVFDATWTPRLRVVIAALVGGAGLAGLLVVRGGPLWISLVVAGAMAVGLVLAVRWAATEVRPVPKAERAFDPEREARSAARYARIARRREARRIELVALRRDDPAGFAAAVLVEVDKEVVKRVHLVRRIKKGQADAADVLVSNVIHHMVGTVDDAEVRGLVLDRARQYAP